VFVVENEELLRQVLEDALTDGGFSVTMASSGEEAVTVLEAAGSDYRALITDVNLVGGLTGWDVARRARELNEKIAVIYMTGASAHDWQSQGVPNSLLITKPFAMVQLVTAAAQLLNAA